jgi:hypothetical protein
MQTIMILVKYPKILIFIGMKSNAAMLFAICMFALPFFECLCCEEIPEPAKCCHHDTEKDSESTNHPCMDAIDSFASIDFFQLHGPASREIIRGFANDKISGVDQTLHFRASPKRAPPIRTHLFIGVQLT